MADVERKAGFIHQVMRGGVDAREVDDVGEQALSFAEVKALATGNPLIMELAGVDNDIAKLERLARSHQQDRRRLEARAEDAVRRGHRLADVVSACDAALAIRQDTHGDRFAMAVGDHRFERRVDAGARLRLELARGLDRVGAGAAVTATLGELGGFPITARLRRDLGDARVELWLEGVPGRRVVMTSTELVTAEPVGLTQRLEHCAFGVEAVRQDALAGVAGAESEAAQAAARVDVPFEHAGRLAQLRQRQEEIRGLLVPVDEADTGAGPEVERPATETEAEPTPASTEPAAHLLPPDTDGRLHPADGDGDGVAPSADLPHQPDEGLEEPQTVRTLLEQINRELDAHVDAGDHVMNDVAPHPRREPSPTPHPAPRAPAQPQPQIGPSRRPGLRGPGL